MSVPALPFAHGGPPLSGVLRADAADFFVDEDLGFEPDGQGEHAFVRVEKRGNNTEWVARQLARFADVAPAAVSYAGIKDRHAVTRQTFSVHLPGRPDPDWSALQGEGLRVLSSSRNSRKLRIGALRGNAFRIVLREVSGERGELDARIAGVVAQGVPNYFGEQRFGAGGGNVAKARALFAGRRVPRHERSLLLSAVRSQLFNEVLAARVATGAWNTALEGDVFMLDGTQSIFGPEPLTAEIGRRLATGDIAPTGPMFGEGSLRTTSAAAELETRVAAANADLVAGLVANGLRQERRALVLRPGNLSAQWLSEGDLELRFDLMKGSYATVVVRELARAALPDPVCD